MGDEWSLYKALSIKSKKELIEIKKLSLNNRIDKIDLNKKREDSIIKMEKLKRLLDLKVISLEEYNSSKDILLREI